MLNFEKYYTEETISSVFKFSLTRHAIMGEKWRLYLSNGDIINGIWKSSRVTASTMPPGEAIDFLTDVNYHQRERIIVPDSSSQIKALRDEIVADEGGLRAIMPEYVDDFVSGRFKVSIKPYLTARGGELLERMNRIWHAGSGDVNYIIRLTGHEIDADLRNELGEFIERGKEEEKRNLFKYVVLVNGGWQKAPPDSHTLSAELAKQLKRFFIRADDYSKLYMLNYLRRLDKGQV